MSERACQLAIVRLYERRWQLPDGAILTALIIAMVLRTQEPLAFVAAASTVAIASKHIVRTHWSNIFNPAAVGLIVVALAFKTGESWWGALPNFGLLGVIVLLLAGIFVANRINKLPLVLTFLAAFACLSTLESFLGQGGQVAELFRTPDLQAALFFAFFMLDDPPTCPIRYEDQIVFGAICALGGYIAFRAFGPDYFFLAGLLIANAWESVRRVLHDRVLVRVRSSLRINLAALGIAGLAA